MGNNIFKKAPRDSRHTAEDRQVWHVRNHNEASVLADLFELRGYPYPVKRRGSCLRMGLSNVMHYMKLRCGSLL